MTSPTIDENGNVRCSSSLLQLAIYADISCFDLGLFMGCGTSVMCFLLFDCSAFNYIQNDGSALGRQTTGVPNPEDPTTTLNIADLESQPTLIQTLIDENFRAVHVAAGDSISVAIGDDGGLRAWGSFRVSLVRSCSTWSLNAHVALPDFRRSSRLHGSPNLGRNAGYACGCQRIQIHQICGCCLR
jgi:hypothetical protein